MVAAFFLVFSYGEDGSSENLMLLQPYLLSVYRTDRRKNNLTVIRSHLGRSKNCSHIFVI